MESVAAKDQQNGDGGCGLCARHSPVATSALSLTELHAQLPESDSKAVVPRPAMWWAPHTASRLPPATRPTAAPVPRVNPTRGG